MTTFSGKVDLSQLNETRVYFSGYILNLQELAQDFGLNDATNEKVVIAVYEKHGTDGFAKLSGAFAFVLVDAEKQQLLLVRDIFGQASLFWGRQQSIIYFSSNLRDIADVVGREPNPQAWREYLTLGYILPPFTQYEKVERVPAATAIVFSSTHKQTAANFFKLDIQKIDCSLDEAVETAEKLISKAIERTKRIANDPILLLSGGVDSNVLLGLMRDNAPECLTIGFDNAIYDERAAAVRNAKAFNAKHSSIMGAPEQIELVRTRLHERDELFADSSLLPNLIAMDAANGRPVLTGSGGDEFFGGYRRYRLMVLRQMLGETASHLFGFALAPFASFGNSERRSAATSLHRLSSSFRMPLLEAYCSYQQIFTDDEIAAICPWAMKNTISPIDRHMRNIFDSEGKSVMECANYLDIQTYLPDDGCIKLALACENNAAFSPIMDIDVTNFALSLPLNLRTTLTKNKPVLRALGAKYLPMHDFQMAKKGFGVPVDEWFISKIAPEKDERFNEKAVQKLLEDHRCGRASNGAKLWAITMAK